MYRLQYLSNAFQTLDTYGVEKVLVLKHDEFYKIKLKKDVKIQKWSRFIEDFCLPEKQNVVLIPAVLCNARYLWFVRNQTYAKQDFLSELKKFYIANLCDVTTPLTFYDILIIPHLFFV